MSPQTNGICDALPHDDIAGIISGDVPQKRYGEPDTLQSDLDDWLAHLIISELIRGKCALAGRLWKYYLMEKASGLRRMQSKCTLINTCINNG